MLIRVLIDWTTPISGLTFSLTLRTFDLADFVISPSTHPQPVIAPP